MPEEKGFLKKLEQNKKLQVIVFVVSMVVIIGVYILGTKYAENSRTKINISEQKVTVDFETLAIVENVGIKDKQFEFSGWGLKVNKNIVDMKLVLQATDGSDLQVINVENVERNDIVSHYKVDWNYGVCGFIGYIKKKSVQENVCYEIQLIFDYKEEQTEESIQVSRKVSIDKYLYNGNLYEYNPQEFVQPKVEDEWVNKVIKYGKLCGYTLENDLYIYQYENQLVWMVSSEYEFLDENMYVPYHIYSTEVSKLPEDRQHMGYDNRDFYFVNDEIVIDNTEYRVAVKELPEEYVISKIVTGVYDVALQKWVWQADFLENN